MPLDKEKEGSGMSRSIVSRMESEGMLEISRRGIVDFGISLEIKGSGRILESQLVPRFLEQVGDWWTAEP